VRVIFNWTDEAIFRPSESDQALARTLGFEGRFNIVYAGNLGVMQGIETVIRAAALTSENEKIQVVLIGTGAKEAELRQLASDLGVRNVLFLSRRNYGDMPKVNALADVLLIHLRDYPFLRATIPGKTQVALASGRPILMAVKGDASEVVRQAGAGLICDPEDPPGLANAMLTMSSMAKTELEEMGSRGREYYVKNLSLDVAFKAFDEVFQMVGRRKEST
jgi:glycosyltransferase involved in cell wall biosynthesis